MKIPSITRLGRQKILLLGGFGLIIIIVWGIFQYAQTVSTKSFMAHIEGLIHTTQEVQASLRLTETLNIPEDLKRYQNRLSSIRSDCQAILDTKPSGTGKNIIAAAEHAKGICQDLIPITKYSSQLHYAVADYMALPRSPWPQPSTSEFNDRLDNTLATCRHTKSALEQIDNTKIADPALNELITEVDNTNHLLGDTSEAAKKKDDAETAKRAGKLQNAITKDLGNFLSARTYFWNNTIGIDRLLKALENTKQGLLSKS